MRWVRMNSLIKNWPGGGSSPSFEISADDNGTAVIELAWDPQALMNPATYPHQLRYYCSGHPYSATVTSDNGASQNLTIPVQSIPIENNRATWTIPADLWNAYLQETLKTLDSPPTTTFSRNLYYRVRVTPAGGGNATVWPSDALLRGPHGRITAHIGILPLSATPSSQVVPDEDAVRAMGNAPITGLPLGDLLLWLWRNMPEADLYRQALVAIFAYFREVDASPTEQLDVQTRAKILTLWLFAGNEARAKIPALLRRRAVTGSGVTQAVITKRALSRGKTLVDNLLDLLWITPHPDLRGVTSNEQLLNDVITEILDPNGQVNQGPAGTCAPTSIQTLLLTVNPAEYARLQVGLLSSSARATLTNGVEIVVPPGIFQAAPYAPHTHGQSFLLRTNSELAFQAAILRYGQGNDFPSLTGTPPQTIFDHVIKGGLSADQSKRALDGIFGVNFTTHYIPIGLLATTSAVQDAQQTILNDFLRDLPGHQQQMLLAVYWGAPYGTPSPPGGGHAILALSAEGGRVFFKNPQYRASQPVPGVAKGGNGTNPPRRYDDPTQAKESISEADLLTWIKGYWVPDSAII